MPEIDNNNLAAESEGADTGAETPLDTPEQSSETGDLEPNQDAPEVGEEENQGDDSPAGDEGGEEEEIIDDDSEPEIKKRLTKRDFIIGRQKARLAKKKAKAKEKAEGLDASLEDIDDIDLEGITDEDKEIISKVVAKQLSPIIEKSVAADDEVELQEFLSNNPDFKPYESKARRFMKHKSRRHLPVKSIFYEVAGDDLLKIGAKRAKQADEEARQSKTGGGSTRNDFGNKGVLDLSEESFEEEQRRLREKL